MTSGSPDANPFVGPRPIARGEPLRGRSLEVRTLADRLVANRLVVLHSPSGAGKSSLVYAGLIPELERRGFDAWTPIRVNLDLAALGGAPEGLAKGVNRYLLSAMVSLEQELPEARRRSLAELAELDFQTYLEARPRLRRNKDKPIVLIFDQFEEVLTVAPRAVAQKHAFFEAIGQALDAKRRRSRQAKGEAGEHPGFWALFVIREDYLAAFAPYRAYLPTQMSNTFRLDFLSREGAKEAAMPLATVRDEAEVDGLIEALAKVRVQQPDGSFAVEAGLYVEPVQLQVVCRRMWRDADMSVDGERGVSEALGDYYAAELGAIVEQAGGGVSLERRIRDWFGTKLIVDGIRSQLRQEATASGGLDNDIIKALGDCYLVRVVQRAGSNWFELSHDRLVEAVGANNLAWEQRHLSPLQSLAKLWEAGGRDEAQLMNPEGLPAAEAWAVENPESMSESDREFLAASQAQRDRQVAARRRLVGLCLGAVAATVAMAFGLRWALQQRALAREAQMRSETARVVADEARGRAEESRKRTVEARDRARTALLMAAARELIGEGDTARAALVLAMVGDGVDDPSTVRGWLDLALGLETREIPQSTRPHPDGVRLVRWSPDGEHVLTASSDGAARLWRSDGRGDPLVLGGHGGAVVRAAFSHDGRLVATGSTDATARLWKLPEGVLVARLEGHSGPIEDLRWSPDDRSIVTASADATARVWAADDSGEVRVFEGHEDELRQSVFSPDGEHLLTTSHDGTVAVWSVDEARMLARGDAHGGSKVFAADWSHDGARAVSGAEDERAVLWRFDGASLVVEDSFEAAEGPIVWAQWSPDDARVALGSSDTRAWIWTVDGSAEPLALEGHGARVNVATWSPDGGRLATASEDMTARVWSLVDRLEPVLIMRHQNLVRSVAWSPDGSRIATASFDRSAKLWGTQTEGRPLTLLGHHGRINAVDWSPDGARLLTGSGGGENDNSARMWTLEGPDRSADSTVLATYEQWVMGAALSPDGARVALAVGDGTMRIRAFQGDAEGSELVREGHECVVRAVAWSPDGSQVVSGGQDGRVFLWRADGGGEPLVFEGHTDRINAVAWSPDGSRVASASQDRSVRLWSPEQPDVAPVVWSSESPIAMVDWSPDGARAVTASDDGVARVWDAAKGEVIREFAEHEGALLSARWSPDGRRVLTTSGDLSARVWVADDPEAPSVVFAGHDGRIMAGAWSPDGRRVATVSQDRTGRVWVVPEIDGPALRARLAASTTDCLEVRRRQDYHAEEQGEAEQAYAACEQAQDRTPSSP